MNISDYINEYLDFRERYDDLSAKTITLNKYWLLKFQEWLGDHPLATVESIEPNFSEWVRQTDYSWSYQKKIIITTKSFLKWLSRHKEITFSEWWLESFKPPRKHLQEEHEAVSLAEIRTIANAPVSSKRDMRIRASAVFLWLSGCRIQAFLSLPIKAVDIPNKTIHQWPEWGVHTKNGKKATTFLLNVPDLYPVIEEWDLKVRHLPEDSIWFANFNTNSNQTMKPAFYNSAKYQRARNDLQDWLERIGMPYYSPHKFRHGHAVYALKEAKNMAQFKAISQNLMHSSVTTTDSIYSIFSQEEVKNQLMELGNSSAINPLDLLAELVAEKIMSRS